MEKKAESFCFKLLWNIGAEKQKLESFCAESSKRIAEFVCVKWKVEKKPNRNWKVFVVMLRENETWRTNY